MLQSNQQPSFSFPETIGEGESEGVSEECASKTSQSSIPVKYLTLPLKEERLGPLEQGLKSRPCPVEFNDYRTMHTYKAKFNLLNISLDFIWCRFRAVEIHNDDIDPNELEVRSSK